MSEIHEAQALADWLADGGGRTPALDADVLEAIYALKPALAPDHAVTIDDILDSLTDGPLVDPAVAESLAAWLGSPPGTPPPRNLPIGVVEATYALRPELAPAPRLSIDEVLSGLSEGPLAAQENPTLRVVETPTVTAPSTAPSGRWANIGGTRVWGAVALAAAILLTVIPDSATVLHAPSPYESDAIADAPVLHDVSFGSEPPVPEADREPVPTGKAKAEEGAVASVERAATGGTDVTKSSSATPRAPEAPAPPARAPRAAKRAPAPAPRSERVPPPPAAMAKSTPTVEPESMPPPRAAALSAPMDEAVPARAVAYVADAGEADAVYAEDMESARSAAVDDASESAPRAVTPRRRTERSTSPQGMAMTAEALREKEKRLRARIRSTDPLPLVKDFSDLAWMLRERGDFPEALRVVKRGLALPGLTRKERVVLLNIKAFILYDLGRETDAQQVEEEIRQLSGSR